MIGSDPLSISRQPRGKWEMRSKAFAGSSRGLYPTDASLQCLQRRDRRSSNPECNPKASCGRTVGKTSRRTRRDPEELGRRGRNDEGRQGRGGHLSGRAEETLQQPGKGETVTSGRGRTDGPHRRKRNKGSDVEGADVMSLRKVTRVGETRAGEKAIREYRRKKQQRRGGRESNRKIEIPSARGWSALSSPRHISRGYEIPCVS